ncbi:MAG: cytochrome c3 family protein [Acidobacteriota bacterium]
MVLTAFVVFAVVVAVLALRPHYVGTRLGKADENYISSEKCLACHENHYASWRRTHHGRMTQEAKAETVQGDFDQQNTFEYEGVRAKMERRGQVFYMNFAYSGGRVESYKIERTVGSRRIEQYVAKENGQYFRLPVAYDLMNRRWMSLNGSFFYPDGTDFKQHFTQWDTNCVFCHNVKAQPNFNFQTRTANTEVAELGIACGACHGQGAEHADLASSPVTRAAWHLDAKSDTRIVDPLKLDSDRSMMVCGHCHGQRIPQPQGRIREILGKGDPFDAGEDLSTIYTPIHQTTTIGNVSFANRFWPDGSPRLTAYEYQGILDSACFKKGTPGNRINCLSCHSMHEGDINGQITEEKRTNAACTQCHAELRDEKAMTKHTKHSASSSGSNCYACHMPDVVYGVQTFHPTHKITIPDPPLTAEKSVPNACSQCHLDRSVNWAIESARSLWPDRFHDSKTSTDAQFAVAEGVRGLFGGDALTRAMMADALARHSDSVWAEPYLIEAFEHDNYPIVRYFAADGLAAWRADGQRPDYFWSNDLRSKMIQAWWQGIEAARVTDARNLGASLRATRKDVDLEVGE